MYKCFCVYVFSFLFGVYIGVELLVCKPVLTISSISVTREIREIIIVLGVITLFFKNKVAFPGGPVVKNPPANAVDTR